MITESVSSGGRIGAGAGAGVDVGAAAGVGEGAGDGWEGAASEAG